MYLGNVKNQQIQAREYFYRTDVQKAKNVLEDIPINELQDFLDQYSFRKNGFKGLFKRILKNYDDCLMYNAARELVFERS